MPPKKVGVVRKPDGYYHYDQGAKKPLGKPYKTMKDAQDALKKPKK